MNITASLTDDAILDELGARLGHARLALQLTQAELATQAGVSKRTVERLEAGGSVQSANLVRVLRVLQRLEGLEQLVPPARPGPMELLRNANKPRRRASSRVAERPRPPWRWGDQ